MIKFIKHVFKTFTENYIVHADTLYGMDISRWEYLGMIKMGFTDSSTKVNVACFLNKEDMIKRKAVLLEPRYEWHRMWRIDIPLWEHGEKPIYGYINVPSKYLKNYMLEVYSAVWDTETEWWIETDQSKYDSAMIKQTVKKVITDDNNVINLQDYKS